MLTTNSWMSGKQAGRVALVDGRGQSIHPVDTEYRRTTAIIGASPTRWHTMQELNGQDYERWLDELKSLVKSARISVARSVSRSQNALYWEIGERILATQQKLAWGKRSSTAFPPTSSFACASRECMSAGTAPKRVAFGAVDTFYYSKYFGCFFSNTIAANQRQ